MQELRQELREVSGREQAAIRLQLNFHAHKACLQFAEVVLAAQRHAAAQRLQRAAHAMINLHAHERD